MKVTSLFLILFFLAACSNKGIYGGIQAGKRSECSKLPPSQYEECLENANKSYDEYERERTEALSK